MGSLVVQHMSSSSCVPAVPSQWIQGQLSDSIFALFVAQLEEEDQAGTFACVEILRTQLLAAKMAAAVGRRAAGILAGALSQRPVSYIHQSPCAASELLSRY